LSTYALEIWQSSFDVPASSPMPATTWSLGIEADAQRDGGVTFTACPFTPDYPDRREGQPSTSKTKIDNVNREFVPRIGAALRVRELI
jgi:hypothetical protein